MREVLLAESPEVPKRCDWIIRAVGQDRGVLGSEITGRGIYVLWVDLFEVVYSYWIPGDRFHATVIVVVPCRSTGAVDINRTTIKNVLLYVKRVVGT